MTKYKLIPEDEYLKIKDDLERLDYLDNLLIVCGTAHNIMQNMFKDFPIHLTVIHPVTREVHSYDMHKYDCFSKFNTEDDNCMKRCLDRRYCRCITDSNRKREDEGES